MIRPAHGLAALLACASCSNPEPAMSAPSPPPPTLSAFTRLQDGRRDAIAPGEPLVTLGSQAVWWEHDAPVTVAIPTDRTYGTRWLVPGKTLRVGLGTLDLAARRWSKEPGLSRFTPIPVSRPGRGREMFDALQRSAWLDANHVAMVLRKPATRGQELVIAAADGKVRGRVGFPGLVTDLVATADRVLVNADGLQLFDLDAKPIARPKLTARRLRDGAGMFAVISAPRGVALVRPSDGAVLATWDVAAHDAVPIARGVIAVDDAGTVRVGCVEGAAIREIAHAASGAPSPIVQQVGDRVVVAGGDPNPIRIATLARGCP